MIFFVIWYMASVVYLELLLCILHFFCMTLLRIQDYCQSYICLFFLFIQFIYWNLTMPSAVNIDVWLCGSWVLDWHQKHLQPLFYYGWLGFSFFQFLWSLNYGILPLSRNSCTICLVLTIHILRFECLDDLCFRKKQSYEILVVLAQCTFF